jgi:hypothetical protein
MTQFGMLRISYTKWLTIIKLFDLRISARRAAKEAGLSYPTAMKVFDTIRHSSLYQLAKSDKVLNGEIEADEAYFGGKRFTFLEEFGGRFINAGLEYIRHELGGYFPSRRSLDVNYFVQIANRNDSWMRNPVAMVRARGYELRQILAMRFEVPEEIDA